MNFIHTVPSIQHNSVLISERVAIYENQFQLHILRIPLYTICAKVHSQEVLKIL